MKVKFKNKFLLLDKEALLLLKAFPWWIGHTTGYLYTSIWKDNKVQKFYFHRVLLMLAKGDKTHVDHINGNKLDNRFKNLRIVNMQENAHNSKIPIHNTSGYKGVSWRSDRKLWRAYIKIDGKISWLGHYKTKEQAFKKYKQAKKEIGFYDRTCN